MPPILIDTNLLVYLYDTGSPGKAAQAQRVLDRLEMTRSGRLSVQCLAEFMNVSTRKLDPPLHTRRSIDQDNLFTRMWPIFDLTPLIVFGSHARRSRPRPGVLRCPNLGCRSSEPGDGRIQRRLQRRASAGRRTLCQPVFTGFPRGRLGVSRQSPTNGWHSQPWKAAVITVGRDPLAAQIQSPALQGKHPGPGYPLHWLPRSGS